MIFNNIKASRITWIVNKIFSIKTNSSVEGQHFKASGKLVSLSEQNLADCVYVDQGGCGGGWMGDAFEYIKTNNGINTEASYRYTGIDHTCKFKSAKVGATVSGYVDVETTEAALQEAVATVGPISAAIDATHPSFQPYTHGVYYEPKCRSNSLHTNHGNEKFFL